MLDLESFLCHACKGRSNVMSSDDRSKYITFMQACSDHNGISQAAVDYLTALSRIPCDTCFQDYMSVDRLSEQFLLVVSTNDTKNMDLICDNPRGYDNPNSMLLNYFLSNTVSPINVEMASYIRQRWNNGVVSKTYLDGVKEYYQQVIEDGDEHDEHFWQVLNSFQPI